MYYHYIGCILFFFWVNATCAQESIKIHSHNDYLSERPFWQAYHANAASIEVDIILKDERLYVAHEESSIHQDKTLQSIYLDPIYDGVQSGIVEEQSFVLLIDIKSEAYATMKVLLEVLEPYHELLYSNLTQSGLKLIISGNRPKVEDYQLYPGFIFFDYQSKSLSQDLPWNKIGMVSMSFKQFSDWKGNGILAPHQLKELNDFIQQVHSFGSQVRFWASPDLEIAWKTLHEMTVDYINTDHPAEAYHYLKQSIDPPF